MSSGYFDSPWPAEDGGPARLQAPRGGEPLQLAPGQVLRVVTRRTMLSTMTVLGAPGEVFLLTHSALRARIGLPTTACVERIDPLTLRTLERSPRLAGGPMWPGGMAVHRNGDLYVVYGRHAHRLDRHCRPRSALELPIAQPYNSFVILDNGLLVTKNLSDTSNARLSVLAPDPLQFATADIECPEPAIARLSAVGNTVYVVGVRSIFRYHWDEQTGRLRRDEDWSHDYIGTSAQSYGWDAVIDGRDAWFMDNGHHRYLYTMRGAGVSPSANRLIRVSLADARDHRAVTVSGLAGGTVTNPPLVDPGRRIVVGFDSGNAVLKAWRIDSSTAGLSPLWEMSGFGASSHMLLFPGSGQLWCNDYRRHGERLRVLDLESGRELGRARLGGLMQGVVFPGTGWNRDVYWSTMGRLARLYAQ